MNSSALLGKARRGGGLRHSHAPMPTTERKWTTSLCTGTSLIVAGGVGEGSVLSRVEVMNSETLQWSTAADLPQPLCWASATACGDCIYILGGLDKHGIPVKSVYTCSLNARIMIWRQVTNVLVICSACEPFDGRLLAIGGLDDSRKPTTAVHMYNSTTNTGKSSVT